MKSTNIIVAATLIIAAFALISMPQIIVSANAQSVRASERACPVLGFTLSKGECIAEPIINFECKPPSLGDRTAVLSGTTCTVTGKSSDFNQKECEEIGGQFSLSGEGHKETARCIFVATKIITCPGDVPTTDEGECITKPGRGNDPT
jgi:hypothetical protein